MIRLAVEDDLTAIVAIYNEAVQTRVSTADTEPVSVESRRSWLVSRDTSHPVWVYEDSGGLLGWVSLSRFYNRPAYEATAEVGIYVAAGYAGRGIGNALLAHAVWQAPELGLRSLLALVFETNTPSVSLFSKHGFEDWGYLEGVCDIDDIEHSVVIFGRKVGEHAA